MTNRSESRTKGPTRVPFATALRAVFPRAEIVPCAFDNAFTGTGSQKASKPAPSPVRHRDAACTLTARVLAFRLREIPANHEMIGLTKSSAVTPSVKWWLGDSNCNNARFWRVSAGH
jgi:hypothetical protein